MGLKDEDFDTGLQIVQGLLMVMLAFSVVFLGAGGAVALLLDWDPSLHAFLTGGGIVLGIMAGLGVLFWVVIILIGILGWIVNRLIERIEGKNDYET